MPTATQKSRLFELTTPLGKDVLLLKRMDGSEALGRPFEWNLDLLSERGDIEAEHILGQKIAVRCALAGGRKRHFHGYVTEFGQEGWVQRYHSYRAVVRPWYWLLTRTADCRIFQDLTVPQIFEQVVKQYGFTDYRLKLSGSYEAREYCVQYRETDFEFLSRLLEEEGIYYFFEHAETKHTMVLVDDPGQHGTVEGYDKVPFYAPGGPDTRRERDHLEAWTYTKSVRTGTFATTDFDFEKPRKSLAASESISRSHDQSHFEVFDYPGELDQLNSGQASQVAKVRIQELQAGYMLARGHGNAAGLASGYRFTLDRHPRKDLNVEYLVTRATYSLSSDAYEAGQAQAVEEIVISIEAIEAKTHFRPERVTPKPVVRGAQTAMVVGKAGEEIYTDKYGRVKVQFHWDRYGKQDEKSSCWVRVAQLWAGKAWGGIHIPRIGQEVIVSFLEGDPDRPIITGRVYNGDSMPPYALPGNATQSGIKSRSSKSGGDANFNEIRFEDLKGSEQLFIHAEKNQDIEVEHDETHWVGHDRTRKVDNDESVTIKRDRSMTIERDKSESVLRHKVLHIVGNHSENVDGAMSLVIGKTLTESVLINHTESVGGAMELTVGAGLAISVGAAMSESVGGAKTESIGGSKSESTGGDKTLQVGKSLTEDIKESHTVSVGKDRTEAIEGQQAIEVKKESILKAKKVEISADDQITLKTGDAEIIMKSNGDITIKGGKITIKASSDLILKGSKIAEN